MIFYSSYRYPLQINDSLTSPTYADTPFFLQIFKYVLIVLFFIALIVLNRRFTRVAHVIDGFLIFCIPIISLSLFKFFLFQEFEFLHFALSFTLIYIFSVALKEISLPDLNSFFKFVFVFSVLIDLLQVLLFYFFDRLPALAYKGSFSVRFGSFLDDPNGFGTLCTFFWGWASVYYKGKHTRMFFISTLITLMVLITQSLTAILVNFIVIFYLCYKKVSFWSVCALLLLIAKYSFVHWHEYFETFWSMKQASVDSHLELKVYNFNLFNILFGNDYNQQEAWWMSLYINYGVIYTVIFFFSISFLFLLVFLRGVPSAADLESTAVFNGFKCLCIGFYFGMFNLPMPIIFPLNFVVFIFLFSLMSSKLRIKFSNGCYGHI